jgi:hypothetical protein
MFEGLCNAIHRELYELDEKFSNGAKMNAQELEHIDKMAHALKSLVTYEAMVGNSEYSGDSYARGRSRTTGRYVSRDGGYSGYTSQDPDGYGRRY